MAVSTDDDETYESYRDTRHNKQGLEFHLLLGNYGNGTYNMCCMTWKMLGNDILFKSLPEVIFPK